MSRRMLTSLAAIILSSCAPQSGEPADGASDEIASSAQVPNRAADIRGTVTRRSGDRVLVEENPAESAGSAKASVRLTNDTRVSRRGAGAATQADIREGQMVSVWFDGPVMESYPVQATAGALVIESGA